MKEWKDILLIALIILVIWQMRKGGNQNSEVTTWVDYRGNLRTIEVSRVVH